MTLHTIVLIIFSLLPSEVFYKVQLAYQILIYKYQKFALNLCTCMIYGFYLPGMLMKLKEMLHVIRDA